MNFWLKITIYIGLFGMLSVLSGCSQDYLESDDLTSRGRWVQSGLDQVRVNRLKIQGQTIFAATTEGLFRRSINKENIPWELTGLRGNEVEDFVLLGNSTIIAGIDNVTVDPNEVLIFRTDDGGATWQDFHNNFGGIFRSITKDPTNPSLLYARAPVAVAKSVNGGKKWELIFYGWPHGGDSKFIIVDPNNPEIIWGGGINTALSAILIKSTDKGESWEVIQMGGESNVFDLVIHPGDSDIVLAGLDGFSNRIDKSADGGKTWKVVNRSFGARALANSKLSDNVVYASGSHREGKLFFAYSTDYGESWELELFKNGPGRMYVNDLLVIPQSQGEVLYLGTNKGVYKFGILYPGL